MTTGAKAKPQVSFNPMSNLLKALKRAEQDRAAARQAQADAPAAQSVELPAAQPAAAAASATATMADDDATALPAVVRMQRDMVRPSERLAPLTSPHATALGPYRGVGISLTLAVLFAVGVGLWARDRDASKPAVSGAISTGVIAPQVATQPTTIPAALRVSEAGPLQLRLDRGVDAIGQAIHNRGKAQ